MKRNGLILIGLWVLSLLAISFYGGVVSYGLFALFTIIPITSLCYLLYVYVFFRMYQRIDSKWMTAKQTGPFYFKLVNDYYLLFASIKVEFYSDFSWITGLDENAEYEFAPKTGITRQASLTCKYRGEYEVGINKVVIMDYFKLFRFTYKNREPLKVVVRPRIVQLDSLKNIDIDNSSFDARSGQDETDILVRKYEMGDDIRQIHWALSAKSGELMLRTKTGRQRNSVGIILATNRLSEDIHEYLPTEDKLLEIDLALTLLHADNQVPVVHFDNSGSYNIKNISRMEEFDEFYEYISQISFSENYSSEVLFEEILSGGMLLNMKTVFFIAGSVTRPLISTVEMLGNRGVRVVVYIVGDRDEVDCSSLNIPRVDIVNIGTDDNLAEVL